MPAIGNGIGPAFRKILGANLNFVSTWDTTQAGSASNTVVLPLLSGGTYNGTIDWGDGNTSALSYANRTHTYTTSGTYTITITGTIEGFQFNNSGDKAKIIDISNWGTLNITTNASFYGCTNLDVSATDAPILTTTSLFRMFDNCQSLGTLEAANWDTSSVTNMGYMFNYCFALTTLVATNWNTSLVTNMSNMFAQSDIDCALPFDTSNVTNFSYMFKNTPINDLSLVNWDVSSGESFSNMLSNASLFNQDIGSWNVSSGKYFSNMFYDALLFNQDISSWDVSNAIAMNAMFTRAYDFNQPIGSWNVSNVTNMAQMFYWAFDFDQDISSWDINQVTIFSSFMTSITLSTANYDALLIAWDAQGAMSYTGTVNFGNSKYTAGSAAETARTSLIAKWGAITDGGAV